MKLFLMSLMVVASVMLSGCLASSRSEAGLNCDYKPGVPIWEMPVACQGH
jgi:hypothetical protein